MLTPFSRNLAVAVVIGALACFNSSCATCPPSGPNYSLDTVYLTDASWDGLPAAIVWNGRTISELSDRDPDLLRVWLPLGASPTREMIEVYDGETPVPSTGVLHRDVMPPGESCPHDGLDYDLRGLANGEYLVVHRLSSSPSGLTTHEGPASTFDGEPALVTTIVLVHE